MPTSMPNLNDHVLLKHSNTYMPRLGFGTYKIKHDACLHACLDALAAGYRHIDTAQLYRNEAQVGEALRQSGLGRDDVFLTTKIGVARGTAEETYRSAWDSVTRLAGEDGYVDLFLVHVPGSKREHRQALWGALERLYREGKARSIGVSNFREHHIEELKEYATIWPPHVEQLELHPWCQQRNLVDYCHAQGITVQAYSPLATGSNMDTPELQALAHKHAKTPAQVLIRYALQKGWVPLPKSQDRARISSNADVFSFELLKDDMETLDALDQGSKGAKFPANVD